jgi:hypothetical protein
MMAERIRFESAIREDLLARLQEAFVIREVFVAHTRGTIYATVIVPMDVDILSPSSEALRQTALESIRHSLSLKSLPDSETVPIVVELDSHERVERDFGGNYFNYTR